MIFNNYKSNYNELVIISYCYLFMIHLGLYYT